jgi:hypothetical protein
VKNSTKNVVIETPIFSIGLRVTTFLRSFLTNEMTLGGGCGVGLFQKRILAREMVTEKPLQGSCNGHYGLMQKEKTTRQKCLVVAV